MGWGFPVGGGLLEGAQTRPLKGPLEENQPRTCQYFSTDGWGRGGEDFEPQQTEQQRDFTVLPRIGSPHKRQAIRKPLFIYLLVLSTFRSW